MTGQPFSQSKIVLKQQDFGTGGEKVTHRFLLSVGSGRNFQS
jgi:hypothetical protein